MTNQKGNGIIVANNKLPFGLCEANGIPIQKGWKPHDAWKALKEAGIVTHSGHIKEIRFDDDGNIEKTTEELKQQLLSEAPPVTRKPDENLTSTELALYFSKLSQLKGKRGENYLTGDEFPDIQIGNKFIISSGTFENPKILKVIDVPDE